MASTFPAAIANEPPPLDASSEEEDSEEFRSHGLKLDVPSGEPTPVSTPYKKPLNKLLERGNNNGAGTDSPLTLAANCHHIEEEGKVTASEVEIKIPPSDRPLENGEESQEKLVHGIKENGIGHEDNEGSWPASSFNDETESAPEVLPRSASEPDQLETQVAAAAKGDCDISNVSVTNSNSTECKRENSDSSSSPPMDKKNNFEDTDNEEFNDFLDADMKTSEAEGNSTGAGVKEQSPAKPDVVIDKTSVTEEDESKCTISKDDSDEFMEFQDFEVDSSQVEICPASSLTFTSPPADFEEAKVSSEVIAEEEGYQDEDEDDFGAFQSIPKPVVAEEEHETSYQNASNMTDDFNDDDDDFGEFAHVPAQSSNQTTTKRASQLQLSAQVSVDETEDFADFQDCSFQSCDVPVFAKPPSSIASEFSFVASKIDTAIKSLFVIDSSLPERETEKIESIDSEIRVSNDKMWSHVQDFEGSKGLMFKWLNSLTEKRLLKSLNVDNSNIMYHEKWGTIEVPKFAASLVQSPLQPQTCGNRLDGQIKSDVHNAMNNNNNVADGVSCQDQDKSPSISTEAQEILDRLRQLPDLSYMRANTLVFPQTSSPSEL